MNSVQSWLVMIGLIICVIVYTQFDKRNKIHCTFHRADKTVDSKWIKKAAKFLVYDGGLYVVSPDRVASFWYNPFLVIPMYAQHADYIYYSPFAMNPEIAVYTDITPNAWNSLNIEKEVIDYDKGNQSNMQGGGKVGMLEKYMPFIILAGFAILGWFTWTLMKRVDMLGQGQNVIEGMLGDYLKR
jgi:hypothetical protein